MALNSGLVERRLGSDKRVIVNIHAANKIYLDKNTAKKFDIQSGGAISKGELIKYLSQDEPLPLFVSWDITDECNFDCQFCYIKRRGGRPEFIRFAESKPYISELINRGLLYCLISGGEPTIHPDFIEIYTFLKQSGVIVEIFTNGSMLHKPEIRDVLTKYPPYKMEISIYGISKTGFNAATQSEANPNNILNNILFLRGLGVNILTKTALTSRTLSNLGEVREWCERNDIQHYFSTGMIKSQFAESDLEQYAIDLTSKVQFDTKRILETTSLDEIKTKKHETKKCFSCAAGRTAFHLDQNLNIKACSYFRGEDSAYNVAKLGLNESMAMIVDRVKSISGREILGCDGCYASYLCILCPPKADEVVTGDNEVAYVVPQGHCDKTRKYFDEVMKLNQHGNEGS